MTANAERYPWDQIPRLTRAEARALRTLARSWVASDQKGTREVTATLLGSSIHATQFDLATNHHPDAQAAFVELTGDLRATCEIPGTLAAWGVDRALGGDAKFASIDAGCELRGETARGVLAYIMPRILHGLRGDYVVSAVERGSQPLRARLDRPHAACVAVTIVVESVSVTIHLWIVEGVVTRDASPPGYNAPLTHALLREHALLSARLIGICRLTAHAASALLLDDVIMLQAAGIAATADGYHGTVTVAVLGARTHHWVARAQGDRIELEQLHTTKDDRMTTGKIESGDAPTTETLTAITDAPLELSVEIARFTLPLGEIARLSIGDVLLTGRPIGEHVTLRAGTRAIGTGELISVDGAIGVRIVTLAGA